MNVETANVLTEHSTLAISLGFLLTIVTFCSWVAVQWAGTKNELKQLRAEIAARRQDSDAKHAEILRALNGKLGRADFRTWIARAERKLDKDLPTLDDEDDDG